MKHNKFLLPIANCPLLIANWILPTVLFLLLIANCQLPTVSFAQNTFRYEFSQKTGAPFPSWQGGGLGSIQQVPSDSGYISSSYAAYIKWAIPPPIVPPDSDAWTCFSLIKLDKYANPLWVRAYSEVASGFSHKAVSDGTPTADNNYIMVGNKFQSSLSNTLIQKVDKNGHIVWTNVYPVGANDNRALKVLPMPDGGVVVMGQVKDLAYSDNIYTSYNTYLMRLDKDGDKTWCYIYDAKVGGEESPSSLQQCSDGGFIIGGATSVDNTRGMKITSTLFGQKGFMMKISADGATVVWARRYGEAFKGTFPISSDGFSEVKQASDGGYIAVGLTLPNGQAGKGWVVKTDPQGVILWQKTFDTRNQYGIDHILVLNDGYLLTSTTRKNNFNTIPNPAIGSLTKITNTGEEIWSKFYDGSISGISLTQDKGFLINQDGKNILKTDPSGNFDNGCYYNSHIFSWVDPRKDTAYTLVPTIPIFTPSHFLLKEITIPGAETCPAVCGINNKPIAPPGFVTSLGCANTDAYISAQGDNSALFSHYKINFGDPGSGKKNDTTDSSMNIFPMYHNYAKPGTYTITMIVYNSDYSASDTIAEQYVILPQPKLILLSPEIHVCKRDTVSIAAQVENYTPGFFNLYTYEEAYLSRGIFHPNFLLSQNSSNINGTLIQKSTLIADTSQKYYVILLYGPENCSMQDTLRVIVGKNKAIITGDTKICKGGTATLQASGGNNYLWSTGATTKNISVSPSSNKTFWVEAKSKDGCRDTAYAYVEVVSGVKVQAFASSTAGCVGDSVLISATGTPNYKWSNGSTSDAFKIALVHGINTYSVSGSSGSCIDTASVRITGDVMPNASISGAPANANFCVGITYILKASGGERYYWNNSFENNPEYTFRGKDGSVGSISVNVFIGGCSSMASVPFDNSIPTSPGVMIQDDECRVCPGTIVTLKNVFYPAKEYAGQNPGVYPENQHLSFLWSIGTTSSAINDSIKVIATKDTIITLTITNSFGCKTVSQERIQVKPNFNFKKDVSPIASCSNTPTTLSLSGEPTYDFNYIWSNGSKNDTIVVTPSVDSMYYVTASADGCTHKDSVWVKAKSNLPKAWINGDSIVCKGVSGTYTAKGDLAAQSYKWLTGNAADTHASLAKTITNNTTLKVVVTFTGGCKDTAEFQISTVNVPQALISGDTLICPGGTANLSASGGIYYAWSTGQQSSEINLTTSTDKKVSLYAYAGTCSDTATVTVKTNKVITATLFCDEDTTCIGTPLTLIAGGGDNYTWNTGSNGEMLGITPPVTTTYTVTVTTMDKCTDSKSITIRISPAPHAQISPASVCQGDSLTLTASGGDTYFWNTGSRQAAIILNNPRADSVYKVKVSVGSCADSTQAKINVLPKPLLNVGSDVSINFGNNVPLFVTGTGSYQWSPAIGLSCTDCASPLAEPNQTTLYYITLKDANGCKSTDSVMVYIDLPCGDVFIPTAFSPGNNDGNNDQLVVRGRCIQSMDFTVFDRWGNKVFESASLTRGWDGTYNGKAMNAATFVYFLTGILTSGETLNKKGTIILMR